MKSLVFVKTDATIRSHLTEPTLPALVPIGGWPLLGHCLHNLDQQGVRDCVVLADMENAALQRFVRQMSCPSDSAQETPPPGDGPPLLRGTSEIFSGIELIVSAQRSSDTAVLARLKSRFDGEPVLLVHADRLADVHLRKVEECHRRHGQLATAVLVKPNRGIQRVDVIGDRVVRFSSSGRSDTDWISGGYFLLEPSVFDMLKTAADLWDQDQLFDRLAEDGQLMAYGHDGFWQTVSGFDDVARLERFWKSGRAPWLRCQAMALPNSISSQSAGSHPAVLVAGHQGYLGSVVAGRLARAGFHVVGLDTGWYTADGPASVATEIPTRRIDIRDVSADDLRGYDAVIHLAGLSGGAEGNAMPEATLDINYRGTVHLAEAAKAARVRRFVYAGSCGIYEAVDAAWLTESSRLNPVTPYSIAVALAEAELSRLADEAFSPILLRLASVYGVSPGFRIDLPVHQLVHRAMTSGDLRAGDAAQWRPLVHVEDAAAAFEAMLSVPRSRVHNQVFNVGSTSQNFRHDELARMLGRLFAVAVCDQPVEAAQGGVNYRVSFEKIRRMVPEFRPRWTLSRGLRQLIQYLRKLQQNGRDLEGGPDNRLTCLQRLLAEGRLQEDLRWKTGGTPHRRVAA